MASTRERAKFSIDYLLSNFSKDQKQPPRESEKTIKRGAEKFKLENLLNCGTKKDVDEEAPPAENSRSGHQSHGGHSLPPPPPTTTTTKRGNLPHPLPSDWLFQSVLHPLVQFRCIPPTLKNFKVKSRKLSSLRSKRSRTAFTQKQLKVLEDSYLNDHYLVGEARRSLARSLHLTEVQVKVWFQNRRTKDRRRVIF